MTKQVVVGPGLTPDWLKKRKGVMEAIENQIILGLERSRAGLTLDQLQLVVEHKNPFDAVAVAQPKSEVVQTVRSVDEVLADCFSFYQNVFEEEVDFSCLRVPERREGFDRLIVVAKGMSPERVFQKCQEHFRCWKYTDNLDEIVFDAEGVERKYRRSDHETYALWVRNRIEADQELKNLSANQLKGCGIPGITLEARELYELKYFKETGKHLDLRNWTFCTGSRGVDGRVPSVSWYGDYDGMRVYWYYPDDAYGYLRSREAVS